MTAVIWGKELGIAVAEIEVNSLEDITLLDDKFEVSELTGTVEAVDTIKFGEG